MPNLPSMECNQFNHFPPWCVTPFSLKWLSAFCPLLSVKCNHLQRSCGEKGTAWLLSKWERAWWPERAQESKPTPAWTGFYCFSGHITSRMVLIDYAQVHYRWLPFTDNKGQNTANDFKEKDVTAQGGKWLKSLHSILWRFSTDFRKLKILSKHLLPQFRVREF